MHTHSKLVQTVGSLTQGNGWVVAAVNYHMSPTVVTLPIDSLFDHPNPRLNVVPRVCSGASF